MWGMNAGSAVTQARVQRDTVVERVSKGHVHVPHVCCCRKAVAVGGGNMSNYPGKQARLKP